MITLYYKLHHIISYKQFIGLMYAH